MVPGIATDYTNRFGGIGRLYGAAGLERLRAAHACVIGVGGVGSWTVEALARTGVGTITMIDLDDVCVTNINRQLPALDGQIGRAKVDVLAERVLAINPECRVNAIAEFLTERTAARLLDVRYDVVVDAIDKVSNKSLLIAACCERKLPVIAVGGAGGKQTGLGIRIADLGESGQDELLRQVRRKLRKEYGFPQGNGVFFGVPCVFSTEKPVYPWSDGSACATREPGSDLTMDCASGFGSATFVTGIFGFAAAGEAVRLIVGERATSPASSVPSILKRSSETH